MKSSGFWQNSETRAEPFPKPWPQPIFPRRVGLHVPHTYNRWNAHHISEPCSYSTACAFQLWLSIVFHTSLRAASYTGLSQKSVCFYTAFFSTSCHWIQLEIFWILTKTMRTYCLYCYFLSLPSLFSVLTLYLMANFKRTHEITALKCLQSLQQALKEKSNWQRDISREPQSHSKGKGTVWKLSRVVWVTPVSTGR